MKTEVFDFRGYGEKILPAMLWLPEGEVRKVLQIAHGMTEHIGRYDEFAQSMTEHGIAVAGFDLRGHGRHGGDAGVASFGEGGWDATIQDMHLFFAHLEERFPGVPHYMMGFSLGSFLLREYLGKYPESVAGAVILGTGCQPAPLLTVMGGIVKGQIDKVGFDGYSSLVRELSFGVYNQKFRPNRTDKDWLCSDEAQLDAYLADDMCRANFSAGLFWEMLQAMKRTGSKNAYESWNHDLPVLLISGEKDPVGNMGKGAMAVHDRMTKGGMKNVRLYILPDARHDVLHEKACGASDEAVKLILNWLN